MCGIPFSAFHILLQVLPSFTIDDVIGSPYAGIFVCASVVVVVVNCILLLICPVTNYTCNPQLCPNGDSDLWNFKQRVNKMGLLVWPVFNNVLWMCCDLHVVIGGFLVLTRFPMCFVQLMLDFVPNHSAVDCPWTSSNINYYIRAPQGTLFLITHPFSTHTSYRNLTSLWPEQLFAQWYCLR
jgi:hypothetical protein